jgi:uncharacterized membrane protein YidH (DUF202 family)
MSSAPPEQAPDAPSPTATKPRSTHLNPNRIRDHLANERTYLSWMRSGISLLGFGVSTDIENCTTSDTEK